MLRLIPVHVMVFVLVFAAACATGNGGSPSQPGKPGEVSPVTPVGTASTPATTLATTPTRTAAPAPATTAASTAATKATPTAAGLTARTPTATAVVQPLFAGYRLEIQEGTFWEYRWAYADRSCAQGSGCSTDEDGGLFRVTLAGPRTVEGVKVYELNVEGRSAVSLSDTERDFGPRWRYLGIAGDRIVVSNGSTLTTLFDARTGKWAGSGYFTDRFDSSELVAARRGDLPDLEEISDWDGARMGPAETVSRAGRQELCEMIAGVRVCPREETFSFTESEYYLPGIGPLAYHFRNAASFSGGGFFSSYETTESVALVGSSLRGDSITSIVEPTTAPSVSLPADSPPSLDSAAVIFGPFDGTLVLDPNSTQIPDHGSGVSLVEGVVDVTFFNPLVNDGDWSYGVTFRHSEEETFHAVYLDGRGRWGHFARAGSIDRESVIDAGTAAFELSPGGANRITVVFGETRGELFINDGMVASLDLSLAGVAFAGDVRAMTGVLPGDDYSGAQTRFTGFTVYELH